MDNKSKYIKDKNNRREIKKTDKRHGTAEEVIYIFEKILEDWKTIKIYNTIIQNNPNSLLLKKNVEDISTGNSKVYPSELSNERYLYYNDLRKKVYDYHINKKALKNELKTEFKTKLKDELKT